jgi:preprotein translocase subunit YajC
MFSSLLAHAHALSDRALPLLYALQGEAGARQAGPRPTGGGGGGGGGSAAGGLGSLLIPLLMVAFLYFFMIRPMGKQRKEQESLNKSLQKGDKVVTSSGIVGTITGMEDQFITLEISEKVRVKFLREAVTRKLDATVAAARGSEKAPSTQPADAKK